MYGRIERFEGPDANRLDASADELRRRVVGRQRSGEPAEDAPETAEALPEGAAWPVDADDSEPDDES